MESKGASRHAGQAITISSPLENDPIAESLSMNRHRERSAATRIQQILIRLYFN